MPMTDAERARLRGLWRKLGAVVAGGDPELVKGIAGDALQWASPLDDPAAAFVLFAFARLAYAFGRTRNTAQRVDMAGAVTLSGQLALRLIGDEAPPPPPPQLPFRADLDG